MENNKDGQYTVGDFFDHIAQFFRYLLKRWWQIGLAVFAGAALGLLLFAYQKPKYEAECSFILEEPQGLMGGLGGLASQFGLDLGAMTTGGNGMFSGDNIFEILSSKVILKEILLTEMNTGEQHMKLADRYLEISGLKEKWQEHPRLKTVNFIKTAHLADMGVLQDSVLNIVYESILKKHLTVERVSKKGTIIKAQVVSIDPAFSKLLVERLVFGSRDFYKQVKTSVSSANVIRLQKKADSLLALLSSRSFNAAQMQYNDPNPAMKVLQVPTELATRDKTILSTLYAEVVKNLEIARTTEMMQTPVIEILDMPPLSLYDNKKGRLFFSAVGGLAVAALYCIFLYIRFNKRKGLS